MEDRLAGPQVWIDIAACQWSGVATMTASTSSHPALIVVLVDVRPMAVLRADLFGAITGSRRPVPRRCRNARGNIHSGSISVPGPTRDSRNRSARGGFDPEWSSTRPRPHLTRQLVHARHLQGLPRRVNQRLLLGATSDVLLDAEVKDAWLVSLIEHL